jgi:hypothetical protein
MITGSPDIFSKFLHQYFTYFEKASLLYSFFPDTDFVTRFHYEPNGLIKRLEAQNTIPNGGLVLAWIDILFKSIRLLMEKAL